MNIRRDIPLGKTPAPVMPSGIQWSPRLDVAEKVAEYIEPVSFPTSGFKAHAGEVMASPRVFSIYWGRPYGNPMTGMSAKAVSLNGFFTMVMNSPYLDALGQYSSGRGTYLGSTWVDHDPGTTQTLNFDQMRDVLINWLDAGLAPQVPTWNERDLLFMIFPPDEITLTNNSGQGDFCGYHWHGHYHNSPFQKDNLFFGVVDATRDASGTAATASHELVEAFTDRSSNGWFSDDSGAEIGDVCSNCNSALVSLGGFPLSSYWLVNQNRCLQQFDLTPLPSAIVPNVIGMKTVPAKLAIENAGFTVHQHYVVDHTCDAIGEVVTQSPIGGSSLTKTAVVTIWIGVRPPHECR